MYKFCWLVNGKSRNSMEDGGVDRTVIDYWPNQLGQMADIPPLLTFKFFDLIYLKLNLRPCGTHG